MKRNLLILLSSLFSLALHAQSQKVNENFKMYIKKVNEPIKIDGSLNDNAWKEAAQVSDFAMCTPFDTLCSPLRTDVRMAYDDKYIYIFAYSSS
jgi:hypothetical protein